MVARIAQTTHVVSAFWVLVLAGIIFVDVSGRYLFGQPLLGATEIIRNSVVSITFLQLPLAIYRGGMIRSTILYDAVGENGRRGLRTLANVLGLAFFLGTAFSAWGPAVEALGVSEYEGEGALRVPIWPTRFMILIGGALAILNYLVLAAVDVFRPDLIEEWLHVHARFDQTEVLHHFVSSSTLRWCSDVQRTN